MAKKEKKVENIVKLQKVQGNAKIENENKMQSQEPPLCHRFFKVPI